MPDRVLRRSVGVGVLFGNILAALLPMAAQDAYPVFALGFGGYPTSIAGPASDLISFDVLLALTTEDNQSATGAQGWSVSLGIEGGSIDLITLDGVVVSTAFHHDHDQDPTTPPVLLDPYYQDLGQVKADGGFALWGLGFHSLDPFRQGAVSAIVLRITEDMRLQPTGTQPIARLRVSTLVEAQDSLVRLYYEDGFRNPAGMLTSNVITWNGTSITPRLGEVSLPIHSEAPVRFKLGDANVDGRQDISDSISILNYLFLGGHPSPCMKSMDLTGDNQLDLSDPVFLLNFLFLHTETPREPYRQCGTDSFTSRLTCISFPPCAS